MNINKELLKAAIIEIDTVINKVTEDVVVLPACRGVSKGGLWVIGEVQMKNGAISRQTVKNKCTRSGVGGAGRGGDIDGELIEWNEMPYICGCFTRGGALRVLFDSVE